MKDYRLHGVGLRTTLDLGAPADAGTPPDVTITVGRPRAVPLEAPEGEILVELVVGERRIHSGTRHEDGVVLRVHGLCDFVCDPALSAVTCIPDPSASAEQLTLLVRGSFLAFWLGLHGACALHASAVEVGDDGAAVAMVAGSGMGKSTLAAVLCAAGNRFVSDDLVRLDDGVPPRWVGCSAELRLRPGAAAVLDSVDGAWPARRTVDGRLAVGPPRSAHEDGPLAAVVVPSPRHDNGPLELVPLTPMEATLQLAAFPRLARWRDRAALEAQLHGVTRLAESVPVLRARIPWGPPFPADHGRRLLEGLGLLGLDTVAR